MQMPADPVAPAHEVKDGQFFLADVQLATARLLASRPAPRPPEDDRDERAVWSYERRLRVHREAQDAVCRERQQSTGAAILPFRRS
jgi:hypothetical protein